MQKNLENVFCCMYNTKLSFNFTHFLGIAVVHEGLSNAWKIFYASVSEATVTTVHHKYV